MRVMRGSTFADPPKRHKYPLGYREDIPFLPPNRGRGPRHACVAPTGASDENAGRNASHLASRENPPP